MSLNSSLKSVALSAYRSARSTSRLVSLPFKRAELQSMFRSGQH